MQAWKIYSWRRSPALLSAFLKSTHSPWASPERDKCNKARRPPPKGQGETQGRLGWGGGCWLHRSYLSFTEDVGTFSRHAHVLPNTQEGETSRHTLAERKQGPRSWHELWMPQRTSHMSAFLKITRLKSCPQTSALCQGLRLIFMSPFCRLTETQKVKFGEELVHDCYSHSCSYPLVWQWPHYQSACVWLYRCATGNLS